MTEGKPKSPKLSIHQRFLRLPADHRKRWMRMVMDRTYHHGKWAAVLLTAESAGRTRVAEALAANQWNHSVTQAKRQLSRMLSAGRITPVEHGKRIARINAELCPGG